MMNCDGKCYLAEQMKAQKEKQDANSTHKFTMDFGVYIPVSAVNQGFRREFSMISGFLAPYVEPFTVLLIREVIKPPKI